MKTRPPQRPSLTGLERRRPKAAAVTIAGALALAIGLAAQDAWAQAAAACGLDEAARQRATEVVQALVQRGHAPGAVLDLRCEGQPWLQLAVGVTDLQSQQPMRQDTLFRIYSMTKPITAMAVLSLVEEGRVGLDDPVSRHLPAFANTQVFAGEKDGQMLTVPPRRPLTVRDLLRHTAGMAYIAPVPHPVLRQYVAKGIDHGGGELIKPGDGSAPVDSAAELVRRIASVPMLAQPGASYIYGNANDVAGHLVEVVSGQRLGAFMQQRLFSPLGMADTGFMVPAAAVPRLSSVYSAASQAPNVPGNTLNRAVVQSLPASKFNLAETGAASLFSRPRYMDFGGAGLVSSADDVQRLSAFFMRRGEGPLRRASLDEMMRNQLPPEALAGSALEREGLAYGLGIGLVNDSSKAPGGVSAGTVFWGGAASTYFWVDPQRRISGVLLTQVFGGDVAPYFPALVEALRAPQAAPAAAAPAAAASATR